MTRLVLSAVGADPDCVTPDSPIFRRVMAREAAEALTSGRAVVAQGAHDDLVADPAPCRCHATLLWNLDSREPGRWLLPAGIAPDLPASNLVPVRLAARALASVALADQVGEELVVGAPARLTLGIGGDLPKQTWPLFSVDEALQTVLSLPRHTTAEIDRPFSRFVRFSVERAGRRWNVEHHAVLLADGSDYVVEGPEELARIVPRAVDWLVEYEA